MCGRLGNPKDEHCVPQCTYISYHICNPIPLDYPKNHTALPYITVMYMLLKYKEAFSLRDEIGTCPNIEVEIAVTDKSPFL